MIAYEQKIFSGQFKVQLALEYLKGLKSKADICYLAAIINFYEIVCRNQHNHDAAIVFFFGLFSVGGIQNPNSLKYINNNLSNSRLPIYPPETDLFAL